MIARINVSPPPSEGFASRPTSGSARSRSLPVSAPATEFAPATDVAQTSARQTVSQPVDREQLKSAVAEVQRKIPQNSSNLQFSVDEDLGVTVVKLMDSQTKDVIRQIPSEEFLKIAKSIDMMQGLLVKKAV